MNAAAAVPATDNKKRKKLFMIFGAVLATLAVLYGLYWFFIGSVHVSTDDAYVQADMAQVTPAIGGTLQSVDVIDTQMVKKGDVLATIDDVDAQLALDKANAMLAAANASLEKAQIDYKRRNALAGSGSVSGEELTNAQSQLTSAEADLATAQAAVHAAQVDVSRTTVTAPVDGTIARRQAQVGQKVEPGAPLMTVVPLGAVYVNANFKEVQLRKVHVGQPVVLESDLYGGSVEYHGVVEGMSGGTGSAFSVIPAQNATGNWIKVVQRVPVRIRLDPAELERHPLQVGLSMDATIDISE